MNAALGCPPLAAAVALALAACTTRSAPPTDEQVVEGVASSLREGRLVAAEEALRQLRAARPRSTLAARWGAAVADLAWRDDEAIDQQVVAVRLAAADGADADELAAERGVLGELLFQAGRWGEAADALRDGAIGPLAERRAAFAATARLLPFLRKQAGPLLTERHLLPGDAPEFLCGVGERLRPFAIDTGTSMTTLSASLADELRVRARRPAGAVSDGLGGALPVEIGVIDEFAIGDVDIGSVPVLVVADSALRLRDAAGGADRAPRGVLGLDLLAAFRLTLDPERDSVVIELPRDLRAEESVRCARSEGRCLVPVDVEGTQLWFVLDTGASHSSITVTGLEALPGGASRAVPAYRRLYAAGGTSVAMREVRDLVVHCGAARFRSVTLPVVARAAAGPFPLHGVLGLDLLGRCRVTLSRGRVSLQAVR